MGNLIALVEDKDANATGSSVEMDESPMLPGTPAIGIIQCDGYSGDIKIQGSDDDSTWSDLFALTGLSSADVTKFKEFTLKKYMRYVSASRTAGDVSVYLMKGGN